MLIHCVTTSYFDLFSISRKTSIYLSHLVKEVQVENTIRQSPKNIHVYMYAQAPTLAVPRISSVGSILFTVGITQLKNLLYWFFYMRCSVSQAGFNERLVK